MSKNVLSHRRCGSIALLCFLIACLFGTSRTASANTIRQLTVAADSSDNEVRHNGSLGWSGGGSFRVGGVSGGTDGAIVFPFRLPQLASGERVVGGRFAAHLSRISNVPSGSVTLSGLKSRKSGSVLGSDFRQGALESGAALIRSGFAGKSTSSGELSSGDAGSAALAAYVNAQYAAGAKAGDWIFLRLSPSQNESDFRFWSFDSSKGSNPPRLELQIGAGETPMPPASGTPPPEPAPEPTPTPTPTPTPDPEPEPEPEPAPVPPAGYRLVTIKGDKSDASIQSNGGISFVGSEGIRVGGSSSGVDSVGVFRFELPQLEEGESIVGAVLSTHLNRRSNTPSGAIDLYGLEDKTGGVVTSSHYYAGSYGGDRSAIVWPLQRNYISNSAESGYIDTSDSASTPITAFITEEYLKTLALNTSVFFRLNSSVANEADFKFWEIATANRSGREPLLTLEVVSGQQGNVPSVAVVMPEDREIKLEGESIRFSLDERLRGSVQDENEVVWHSSLDGTFGKGFRHDEDGLSVGTHTITVMWFNTSGAVIRRTLSLKVAPRSSLPTNARSLTYAGVTWDFDKEYLTGRFITGEQYVVAPNGLTITRITPGWDGTKNGTELNPSGSGRSTRQGFDKRVNNATYDSSLNVADNLPVFVPTNTSVVSSRGRASKGPRGMFIDDVAVLTVLPTAPPAHSFRPPYAGTDKRVIGGRDDIDYSFLKNLTPPDSTRSPSSRLSHILLDLFSQWQNSSFKTEMGEHNYGRQIAYAVADTALWLNLDWTYAEKQVVMQNVIQRGIDVYGSVKSGVVFSPNGGHNNGRKLLLVMAARAMKDSEMLIWADGSKKFVFQEDMQHFIVSPSTLLINPLYKASHLGIPEWSSNPVTELQNTSPDWEKLYRDVNGGPNTGIALAAELMGLRSLWNYEPFFRYHEEVFWPMEEENRSNSLNEIYHFYADLWERYKD